MSHVRRHLMPRGLGTHTHCRRCARSCQRHRPSERPSLRAPPSNETNASGISGPDRSLVAPRGCGLVPLHYRAFGRQQRRRARNHRRGAPRGDRTGGTDQTITPEDDCGREMSRELTTLDARRQPRHGLVTTVSKPRGTVATRRRDTGFSLRFRSSGVSLEPTTYGLAVPEMSSRAVLSRPPRLSDSHFDSTNVITAEAVASWLLRSRHGVEQASRA